MELINIKIKYYKIWSTILCNKWEKLEMGVRMPNNNMELRRLKKGILKKFFVV
jgi:hypothetical protein